MRTAGKVALGMMVLAVGAWFFYTPYWTVHQMRAAAEAENAVALSTYIDFPQVKQNLKSDWSRQFNDELTKAGVTAEFR